MHVRLPPLEELGMTSHVANTRSRGARRWAIALALITIAASSRPLAAQTGTVTGRVTDARSGFAVRGVQVAVPGTSIGAATDVEGRYRLTGVPATAREITAKRIGYRPVTSSLALDASGSATVNFTLSESATTLEATVITGAVGDTRKRAIGNSVSTVNATDVVAQSAVANITEVLQA